MEFKTRFPKSGRHPRVTISTGPGRTKPEFAKECNVNWIMDRYRKTGQLPQSALSAAARYGDFSQIPSFDQMHDKVIAANELFAALPAKVRQQFNNDPGAFLASTQSPEGRELLHKLGLGKEPAKPVTAPPTPSPSPDEPPAPKEPSPRKRSSSSTEKVD